MEQLMKMRLFSQLRDSLQSNELLTGLEEAYKEFAQQLLNKLQTGTNLTELYFNLSYVRLELAGVQNNLPDGQGEKCFKYCK
jgi:hypothetical protein